MTQKHINTNNLLFATFLTTEPDVLFSDLKKAGTLESMHYADDWIWLMPVVEKIESLSITGFEKYYDHSGFVAEGKFSVQIIENTCRIYANLFYYHSDRPVDGLHKYDGKTKLDATYKACVEFVKWWNEANKCIKKK